MSYQEFQPPPGLSNVIGCVWTRLPDASQHEIHQCRKPVSHTVLPDGAMDIIATFFPDGESDETFVVGSMTAPQLATLDNFPLIGVRFLPGVGGSALGANATTLTDQQIDIRDVFKHTDEIRNAFRTLRMNAASEHAAHLFAKSIGLQKREVPPLVRMAAKELGRLSAPVRIEQVARNLQITRQHLTRIFSAHSGLTPKLFAQICRVRALLSAAQWQLTRVQTPTNERAQFTGRDQRSVRRDPDTWSSLAAEFGYVDQSHLIAEVHAIIGQTPAAWQASAGSNIPIVPVPVGPL